MNLRIFLSKRNHTFQNEHEGRDTKKTLNWGGMPKGRESSVLKG